MKNLDGAYRISRFCHFIALKNSIALYHSLTFRTIMISREISKILELFRNGTTIRYFNEKFKYKNLDFLLKKIIKYQMLIPIMKNEFDDLHLLAKEFASQPDITGMYMMLTDLCNYACKYCFVETPLPKQHKFIMMPVSVANKSVKQFDRWSNKKYVRTIIFCGGEPLLNKKVLYKALSEIDRLPQKENIKLQVITNGSLVDEEFIKAAQLFKLKVSVSIDGMSKFHDSSRVYKNGQATHEDAVRGYNMLKNSGVSVGVSMTISHDHLGHIVENVTWLIEKLQIKSIGFNTLMDINRKAVVSIDYAQQVNCEMLDAFKVLRSVGIYEDRIMRKIESFAEGTPYLHDCSGCGHQIVIAPNGKIGVCHGYCGWNKYFIKPTKKFNPMNHKYWQEWAKRSPINMPQCYGCEALGICGGGCPCSADVRNGSIWSINETFCIHSKMVLRWMLQEIAE